ncbi:tRNA lysidine(34) synthetase TilS [Mongoliimonas terrestris]|uniref:tRNA lysidine(34) synthetase TilS n=1 Tax=Mongoliimonas terrestris TaxID=1709001 RepID=UPI0009496455|nr:tRNA lysidine(34) synthetase TilS [Mongoliimonas terrestris]
MTAAVDDPIADADLDGLFGDLGSIRALGVAVSGGPDSTALLHLLHRHAARSEPSRRLVVFTVDHRLRPEAAREAAAVMAMAAGLGLSGEILAWEHDAAPPVADLQAAARAARYRLIAEAAHRHGVEAVALGHTLDDQAETFLMRLIRGSGVYGLAGMPRERCVHGMRFVRPLLGVPKARLVAACRAAGLTFAVDPSNTADRFLRARVRRLAPALAEVGLTASVLAETAHRLARAAAVIDGVVADLRRAAVTDHGGVVSIAADPFRAAPDEVALRLLSGEIRRVRPTDYPPRIAALEAFLDAVRAAPGPIARRTVAGVVIEPKPDRLWLYAEAGRRGFPEVMVSEPCTLVWDGRIPVPIAAPVSPGTVVRAARKDERRKDLPARAASSLPVVVTAAGVLAGAGRGAAEPAPGNHDCGKDEAFR